MSVQNTNFYQKKQQTLTFRQTKLLKKDENIMKIDYGNKTLGSNNPLSHREFTKSFNNSFNENINPNLIQQKVLDTLENLPTKSPIECFNVKLF